MIYSSIIETIGNTPVVKLMTETNSADVYVKLEYFNPGGSVKDRIAFGMIDGMEREGILNPEMTIVEPTSGNTGIGIALVAAAKGYKTILTMPETMSVERQELIKAYGATIILTEGKLGMKGAIAEAEKIVNEHENHIMLSQFKNQFNPLKHTQTTALELMSDFGTSIDVFVAGVGTGGTITGVSQVFSEKSPNTKIVAVEPSDSQVLSGGKPGPHKIQGIGAGFIPEILKEAKIDEIVAVETSKAIEMTRALTRQGLLLGISSGAAVYAATEIAKLIGKGKKVVVIAADNGERYLSTELFKG